MNQTDRIHAELKRALRGAGITYAALAGHLELSEASVKRLFQTRGFSLARLEKACAYAGIEVSELISRMNARVSALTELTPAQERELIGNRKLLLMIYLLLNQWTFDEIVATFDVGQAEGYRLLRRLEGLGMLEVLPFDRVKLLTARNFRWRRNGPVQRFFREQVQNDFFESSFAAPSDQLYFVGARLSPASMRAMHDSFEKALGEFDDLAQKDAALDNDQKEGCAAVLAIRHWEFAAFKDLRRA